MNKTEEILSFLKRIVIEASELSVKSFSVESKGSENDLITDLDIDIENYLIDEINDEYPEFGIISEEMNYDKTITENCFVIDPIDGTINFANGVPFWGIQVACIINFNVVAAVIFSPRLNELYYATEAGAYLNDIKINCSVVSINNALYAVDGSNSIPIILKVKPRGSGMRKFGAVCVSMSFVACGRIHGALFTSDKPWDYLPGLFIAKMAGAFILDEPGFHAAAMTEEFLNRLKDAVDVK